MPDQLENIGFPGPGISLQEHMFNTIFREHEYKLYTLALRPTKSDQYAKDIIQEVFMKLLERRDRMHEIENVEAWLYRVTENKVVDFLRRASADNRLKKAVWLNLQEILNDTGTTKSRSKQKTCGRHVPTIIWRQGHQCY